MVCTSVLFVCCLFYFFNAIMPAIICTCPLSENTISIQFFITFDFYAPSAPSSSVIPELLEEVIKYICCIQIKVFFCLIVCNCPVVVLCIDNHILQTEAPLPKRDALVYEYNNSFSYSRIIVIDDLPGPMIRIVISIVTIMVSCVDFII